MKLKMQLHAKRRVVSPTNTHISLPPSIIHNLSITFYNKTRESEAG